MTPHPLNRRFVISVALMSTYLLNACTPETASISYLAVNHTSEEVVSVVINGEGGVLNVPAYGGGGGQICCVTLPRKWHPGLQATIKWRLDGDWLRDGSGKEVWRDGKRVYVPAPYKEKTVEIPKYTEKDLEHLDIHFLPDDEVLVKVSFIYPTHPDYRPSYPGKGRR